NGEASVPSRHNDFAWIYASEKRVCLSRERANPACHSVFQKKLHAGTIQPVVASVERSIQASTWEPWSSTTEASSTERGRPPHALQAIARRPAAQAPRWIIWRPRPR